MALEMKYTTYTTNHYTVEIKYVEFDPNLYDLKLLSLPEGSTQSLQTFYNSVYNVEAAINGGLFDEKEKHMKEDVKIALVQFEEFLLEKHQALQCLEKN